MNYHYTQLGAIPALASRSTEKRDALLARTGPAARAILASIRRLPFAQRVPTLNRVLADFDPGLPTRVHRVTEFLVKEGMGIEAAVERALALSLADASIEKIKGIGLAYQAGLPVDGLGCLNGCRGLGTTTPTTPTTPTDPGAVVGSMFQGIICSQGLQAAVTDTVGRNEGRDAASATNIGFTVGQGFAMCPPSTPTPTVPTPTTPAPEERSLVVPIVIGASAIAVIGGIAWYMKKKA